MSDSFSRPTYGIAVSDSTSPKILRSELIGIDAATGSTKKYLKVGDKLRVVLTSSEVLTSLTDGDRVSVSFGGVTRYATFVKSDGVNNIFEYEIVNENTSKITLGRLMTGKVIKDFSGNKLINNLPPQNNDLVVDTTASSISKIVVNGVAKNESVPVKVGKTLIAGDRVNITLTSKESVTEFSAEDKIDLVIGGVLRQATYVRANGNDIVFQYTIQAGETNLINGVSSGIVVKRLLTKATDTAGNPLNLTLPNVVSALKIDSVAPSVVGREVLTNADGKLALVFDEAMTFGTGNILVKKTDGSVVETLSVNSVTDLKAKKVSWSGDTLTVNPASTLAEGSYYLQMDSGVLLDSAGNAFGGFSNAQPWQFQVSKFFTSVSWARNAGKDGWVNAAEAKNMAITGKVNNDNKLKNIVMTNLVFKDVDTGESLTVNSANLPKIAANGVWTLKALAFPTLKEGHKYYVEASLSSGGTVTGRGTSETIVLDKTAPTIDKTKTELSVLDRLGQDKTASNTAKAGDVVQISLTSSELISGFAKTDKLSLIIGKATRYATFVNSVGNKHIFQYTVQKGDADGVALKSLITKARDLAGNALVLSPLDTPVNKLIIDTLVPSFNVSAINGLSGAGQLKTSNKASPLVSGDQIEVVLIGNKVIGFTVSDKIEITVGNTVRYATWFSTNNTTKTSQFRYVIQPSDNDTKGGVVVGRLLSKTTDTVGNAVDPKLTNKLNALYIDNQPTISSAFVLAIDSNNASKAIAKAGDTLQFILTSSEDVVGFASENKLTFTIGGVVRNASYVRSSGDNKTGGNKHLFQYVVGADDKNVSVIELTGIVSSTAKDLSGKAILPILKYSIAEISIDTQAPVVVEKTMLLAADRINKTAIDLSLVFNEPVQMNAGVLEIWETGGATPVATITVPNVSAGGSVTLNADGKNLLVHSVGMFSVGKSYYVKIPTGMFSDFAGNLFAGFGAPSNDGIDNEWAFKLSDLSTTIIWEGDVNKDGYLNINESQGASISGKVVNLSQAEKLVITSFVFKGSDGKTITLSKAQLPLIKDDGTWSLPFTNFPNLGEGVSYKVEVEVSGNSILGNPVTWKGLSDSIIVDFVAPSPLTLRLATDSGENASDGITNGSVVYVNGIDSGTVWSYRDGEASWITGTGSSFVLFEGTHTYTIRQVDVVGNSSSVVVVYSLDTSIPVAPSLNLLSDTGNASDGVSSLAAVEVLGLESSTRWEYQVDGTGMWFVGSANRFEAMVGRHTYVVRQVDKAGNVSSLSLPVIYTVDATAPLDPSVRLLSDTGNSISDGVSNVATVVVSNLEQGALWQYQIDDGGWITGSGSSFDAVEGQHVYVVRQMDIARNSSGLTKVVYTLDKTPPLLAIKSSFVTETGNLVLIFNEAVKVGTGSIIIKDLATNTIFEQIDFAKNVSFSQDGRTIFIQHDKQFKAGSNYYVTIDSGAFKDVAGNSFVGLTSNTDWRFLVSSVGTSVDWATDIGKDGFINIAEWQTAGIVGRVSNSTGVTNLAITGITIKSVDGKENYTITALPTIASDGSWSVSKASLPSLKNGSQYWIEVGVSGSLENVEVRGGSLSQIVTLDISPPVVPLIGLVADTGLSSIDGVTRNGQISVDRLESGATWFYQVDSTGAWITGIGSGFVATSGEHTYVVKQIDKAGNSSLSNAVVFTWDTTAPSGISIRLASDTGLSSSDSITNWGTVHVFREDGTSWQYRVDGGNWTSGQGSVFTAKEGEHTYEVVQFDLAGNSDSVSAVYELDTQSPGFLTLRVLSDTGISDIDRVTSNPVMMITGVERGAVWEYQIDGVGNWLRGGENNRLDAIAGKHTYFYRQIDKAGNIGSTDSVVYTLDINNPLSLSLVLASDNGISSSDGITNISTINILNLESGGIWQYKIDGLGDWLLGAGSNFAAVEGRHTYTVRQMDVSSNFSEESNIIFTLDTVAPTVLLQADSVIASGDLTLVFNESVVLGSGNLVIRNRDGSVFETISTQDGKVFLSLDGKTVLIKHSPFVLNNIYSIMIDAGFFKDLAGNSFAGYQGFSDWSLTSAVLGGTVTWNGAGTDGYVSKEEMTAGVTIGGAISFTNGVTTPVVSGITFRALGGVGKSITLAADKLPIVASDGTWSLSVVDMPSLDHGTQYVVEVMVSGDLNGKVVNGKALSSLITVDTVPPETLLFLANDTGASKSDLILNDATVVISNVEDGAIWQYRVDGVSWLTGSGTSLSATTGLHTYEVRQIDKAGNFSASRNATLLLDKDAPLTPNMRLLQDTGANANDGITSVDKILIDGLESGAIWQYKVDEGNWITGLGSVILAMEGRHIYKIKQFDLAGNESATVATGHVFILDTKTPIAPILSLVSDSGYSNSDGITNVLGVRVEGLESGAHWEYQIDGGAWQNLSGDSFDAVEGKHIYAVKQTDTGGNSVVSLVSYNIDKTPPKILMKSDVVALGGEIILVFDEEVRAGVGNIVIRNVADGAIFDEVVVTSDRVSWSANFQVAYISHKDLVAGNNYYITVANGVFKDVAGNNFAGFSQKTDWQFSGSQLGVVVDWDNGIANDGYINITELATNSIRGAVQNPSNISGVSISNIVFKAFGTGAEDIMVAGSLLPTLSIKGTWTLANLAMPNLKDGVKYVIEVSVSGEGGSLGKGFSSAVIVDTTAPIAPSLFLAMDNGESTSDGVSSIATVNVKGLEFAATWQYQVDGGSWQTGTGFSFNATAGQHTYSVKQMDVAGNWGQASNSVVYMIDAQLPSAIRVVLVSDTGSSASDGITNLSGFRVEGLESGASWQYQIDNNGYWLAGGEIASFLSAIEGKHTYMVRQVDAVANVGPVSSVVYTLDTQAPEAPIFYLAVDSLIDDDKITNNSVIVVSPNGESSGIWQYSIDGGSWITGNGSTFSAGSGYHTYKIRSIDIAGNVSADRVDYFTYDNTTPLKPTLALFSDTGLSASDGITSVSGIRVTGLENGVLWQYRLDGGNWITGNHNNWVTGGAATFDAQEGSHTYEVRQIDKAGNSSASVQGVYVLNTKAPTKPSLSLVSDSGLSGSDSITNIADIRVTGLDTGAIWEYQIDGAGSWFAGSVNGILKAQEGIHAYMVRQTDALGNRSVSDVRIVTLDTVAPKVFLKADTVKSNESLLLVFDEAISVGTGSIVIKNAVGDAVFETLAVQGIDGQMVSISDDRKTLRITHKPFTDSASYYITFNSGLFTDIAGNVFGAYSTKTDWNFVASPISTSAVWGSEIAKDGYLNIEELKTAIVSGKLNAPTGLTDASITEIVFRSQITGDSFTIATGLPTIASDNTWTLSTAQLPRFISGKQYVVEVSVGGNLNGSAIKGKGFADAVVVDTVLPADLTLSLVSDTGSSSDGITRIANVKVSGMEFGASFEYQVDGGAWISGVGSAFLLQDGRHSYVVRQVDQAKNIGAVSSAVIYTFDQASPVEPSLRLRADTGLSASDGITKENIIDVLGLEKANTVWQYKIDAGEWIDGTVTNMTAITGQHTYSVRQFDEAGNSSSASLSFVYELDQTAPSMPSMRLLNDTGRDTQDGVSRVGDIRISGLDANGNWWYRVDDGAWITGVGYSFIATTGLHSYVVKQEDMAGNSSLSSVMYVDYDKVTPSKPSLKLVSDSGKNYWDGLTAFSAIEVLNLENGATWEYQIDGSDWQQGAGLKFNGQIGVHAYKVRQTDKAGNVSETSDAYSYTIDVTSPLPLTLNLEQDTGLNAMDGITRNGIINITGFETAYVSWEYRIDEGGWQNVGNNGGSLLAVEGRHTYEVRQISQVGLVSDITQAVYTLDTQAPAGLSLTLASDSGLSSSDRVTNIANVNALGLENDLGWSYRVDGRDWITGNASGFTATEGYHTYEIRQVDIAGNSATATAVYTLDTKPPTILYKNSSVGDAGQLLLIFDESVRVGSGDIVIKSSNGDDFETISVSSDQVSFDNGGQTVSIRHSNKFSLSDSYYVVVPAGAFKDGAGNVFAGYSASTDWPVIISSVETSVVWSGANVDAADGYLNNAEISNAFVQGRITTKTGVTNLSLSSIVFKAFGTQANGISITSGLPTVVADGSWSLTRDVMPVLKDGVKYVVEVTILGTDSGRATVEGKGLSGVVGIDRIAPVVPRLNLVSDTGVDAFDGITSYAIVSVSNLEEGAKWEYRIDNSAWASGNEFSLSAISGQHTYFVRQIDAAKNVSQNSEGFVYTLQTQTTGALSLRLVSDTGLNHSDGLTALGQVEVVGVDTLRQWVYQIDGGNWLVGSGSAFSAVEGLHTYRVRQADVVGDFVYATDSYTLDTDPPRILRLRLLSDTGVSASDGNTSVETIIVSQFESVGGVWEYRVDNGQWISGVGSTFSASVGTHIYSVRQYDLAGNSGFVSQEIYTYKPSNVAKPVLSLVSDTGIDAADGLTNFDKVNIDGVANLIWEYQIDTQAWSSGTGTTFSLQKGQHSYRVRVSDVFGNSNVTDVVSYTLDTDAPLAPTIQLLNDSGMNTSDGITNISTVKILGVDEGSSWQYRVNGGIWLSGSGSSFNAASGLHTYVVKQIDRAGNESQSSVAGVYNIVTSANVLGMSLADDSGIAGDGITRFAGVHVSGLVSGSAWNYQVDGTGAWISGSGASFMLSEGEHTYQVRQIDTVGNTALSSALFYKLDTSAPQVIWHTESLYPSSAPIVLTFNEAVRLGAGNIVISGGITPETIVITAGQSTQVTLSVDGRTAYIYHKLVGSTFELTVSAGVFTDIAGNNLSVYQAQIAVSSISSNVQWTNQFGDDDYINKNEFQTGQLSGTVAKEAGISSVSIAKLVFKSVLSNISDITLSSSSLPTVAIDGTWTLTKANMPTLDDGQYIVEVSLQGSLGGNPITGSGTSSLFILDTKLPATLSLRLATDTGSNANDFIGNNDGINVFGIEQGAIWQYQVDGAGKWITGVGSVLRATSGQHTYLVRQIDVAKNEGPVSQSLVYNLDTSAPLAPSIRLLSDAGQSSSDNLTNVATLVLSNLELSSSWEYKVDEGVWLSGGGSTFNMIDGRHSYVVRQIDLAGNVSTLSNIVTVTLDTTPPSSLSVTLLSDTGANSLDGVTNNRGVSVVGFDSDTTWYYQIDNGNTIMGGNVSQFDLSSGKHTYSVSQMDQAGNVQTTRKVYELDTIAPQPLVLSLLSDTGLSNSDGLTNNAVIKIIGLEANASWQYRVDAGSWTDIDSGISIFNAREGQHTYAVRQFDTAGNSSVDSQQVFSLYTSIPATPTLSLVSDTGSSTVDRITRIDDVMVSGLSLDLIWSYRIDGGNWQTGSGSGFKLSSGTHTYAVRQSDITGNASVESSGNIYTLDTSSPTVEGGFSTSVASILDLFLTFNEVVALGSGNIVIKNSADNSVFETISPTSGKVLFSPDSKTVYIRHNNFVQGNSYYVQIDNGALTDTAGNGFGVTGRDWSIQAVGIKTSVTWENGVDSDGYINTKEFSQAKLSGKLETGVTLLNASITAISFKRLGEFQAIAVTVLPTIASDGTWTLSAAQFPSALSDDIQYVVEVSVQGSFNGSLLTGTGATRNVVILDRNPPALLTVSLVSDTGNANSDGITNVANVSVSGLENNANWQYRVDGGSWQTGSGAGFLLTTGSHSYFIKHIDVAGNSSVQSRTYTLDNAVTPVSLKLTLDSGVNGSDLISNQGEVQVLGLESGATWAYQTDGTGNWIAGLTTAGTGIFTAANGSHSYVVRQTDVADNTGLSSGITVNFDGANPILFTASKVSRVLADDVLTLSFNENIFVGTGTIYIKKASDGQTFEQFNVASSPKISISGTQLSISHNSFEIGQSYYVQITNTALQDTAGNFFAGFLGSTDWQFSVGLPPVTLSATVTNAGTGSGSGGFIIQGEAIGAGAGYSVSGLGDVNGDGLDDLLIGEKTVAVNGVANVGRAYVVFGQTKVGASSTVWLTNILAYGQGGFVITGSSSRAPASSSTFEGFGRSVSGAGDINGDGLNDILVGSQSNLGRGYIIFGKSDTTGIDLGSANLSGVVEIYSETSSSGDFSVASAGDTNGDGLADVIVGLKNTDNNKGRSYVVFGKTNFGTAGNTAVQLSNIVKGTGGYVINGKPSSMLSAENSGSSVAGIGDINGDGLADLAIGAPGATDSGAIAGQTYIVFGKVGTSAVNVSALTATSGTKGGFIVYGQIGDHSGVSVSSAGDVNGDGLADLIVGADSDGTNSTLARSRAYVVFGKNNETNVYLNALGQQGFAIMGVDENSKAVDGAGFSVSSAGDINGDGLADLLVGVPYANSTLDSTNPKLDAGKAFIIFGKTDSVAVELSDIALGKTGGITLSGEYGDNVHAGYSVSSAGDVNGDGLADLFIGAPDDGARGRGYVVFGSTAGAFVETKVDWMGSSSDLNHVSTSMETGINVSQTLIGGGGNNILTAGGGADVLYGGMGNDTFIVKSTYLAQLAKNTPDANGQLAKISGGAGIDTIQLSGGANLDLTAIANISAGQFNVAGRISSIEKIDLATDTAINILELTTRDIQDMAGMNWINTKLDSGWADGTYDLKDAERYHQVLITGGTNDIAKLSNVFSPSVGTVKQTVGSVETTYNVYRHNDTLTELFIQNGVQISFI